jgi:single-strand DNA-binding protein
MLNQVTIMGRLGRDPELRRTGSGTAVTSFSLAVDRDYTGKDGGERQTDWIDCVAWRNTAEFINSYFSKGRMAVVVGRLQVRDWTDDHGNKRKATEVIVDSIYFGDSKREATGSNGAQQAYPPEQQFQALDGDDAQLPF